MITAEPDITRLLARLKGMKLIRQHRDRQDRRVVWTQISEAGLALLEEMDPVIERAPRELLGHLSRGGAGGVDPAAGAGAQKQRRGDGRLTTKTQSSKRTNSWSRKGLYFGLHAGLT